MEVCNKQREWLNAFLHCMILPDNNYQAVPVNSLECGFTGVYSAINL